MKVLLFVLAVSFASCCLASTLTDEQKADLKKFKEACIAESGVDAAVVDAIIKGGAIKRDEKLDCYSSCLLKKLGVQREDGTIDTDKVKEIAGKTNADITKVNEVLEKCKGSSAAGKTVCESGGNALGCFIKEKTFPILD